MGIYRFVPKEINIPKNIHKVIMEYISPLTLNVLWNGFKLGDFIPSQGTWQGDPISLYLFVLWMDKLSHIILEEV